MSYSDFIEYITDNDDPDIRQVALWYKGCIDAVLEKDDDKAMEYLKIHNDKASIEMLSHIRKYNTMYTCNQYAFYII